jgi:hypothetical protein
MKLSREAKLVSGVILLVVPTIMYGGITLLGILTKGVAGVAPGELSLDEKHRSSPRKNMNGKHTASFNAALARSPRACSHKV